jgi:hypothetical protein
MLAPRRAASTEIRENGRKRNLMNQPPAWPTVRVSSWDELTEALNPSLDAYHVPPTYLYRGHADVSWALEPSLTRRLRDVVENHEGAHQIERLLEDEFQGHTALFPETQAISPYFRRMNRAELWSYMQHYSCATRLLDWTASAYIAAYFAVCEFPERDGALLVVTPNSLNRYAESRGLGAFTPDLFDGDASKPERVCFTWPDSRAGRASAQQSHFSVSSNILGLHDGPVLEACAWNQARHPDLLMSRKIIIAARLKLIILQQLRAMNVAPHALFPGIDGLGRSLSDLASLLAVLSRQPRPEI